MLRVARLPDVVSCLERERGRKPELDRTLELHLALLVAQMSSPERPAHLDARDEEAGPRDEEIRRRLREGAPLIQVESLLADWGALVWLCGQVCRLVSQHRPELASDLEAVSSLMSDRPAASELIAAYLASRSGAGFAAASGYPALLGFALNHTLRPFLRAAAEAAAPLVDDESWGRPFCPVCGGAPDLAALESGGGRRLLCSRCDVEWHFRRVGCPFCGSEGSISYWPSEGGAYRLYVCEACRAYLKTVDEREVVLARPLPAERILTVELDLAAQAAGYQSLAG